MKYFCICLECIGVRSVCACMFVYGLFRVLRNEFPNLSHSTHLQVGISLQKRFTIWNKESYEEKSEEVQDYVTL